MAAADTYHIRGGLRGRAAATFIGGDSDDGIQIDSFMAARVTADDTTGTFTAWFNVADNTGTYCVLGGGDASAVQYFYIAVVAGEIQVKAALIGPNVAWDLITIGAAIKPHIWNHVALVHNGERPKVYVNGVEFTLSKGTLTETDLTEPSFWFDDFALIDGGHIGAADSIAGAGALTLEMKGAISAVSYWTDPLTSAQVLDDFNNNGTTTSLVDRWDMIENVLDDVGSEDGTIAGEVMLVDNYAEFTSKWRFQPLAEVVIADWWNFSVENETGYAIIIKAA